MSQMQIQPKNSSTKWNNIYISLWAKIKQWLNNFIRWTNKVIWWVKDKR